MTTTTSSESSNPQFELNALAPLRIGGLAKKIIAAKDDPALVERLARELLSLEPHILELFCLEADKTEHF
jgi:hypothetical protein